MSYAQESDMYPLVIHWLDAFLRTRYGDSEIRVFDSSRRSLAKLIQDTGLFRNLSPEWLSWDIHVDVVGFVIDKKSTDLAFVECKNSYINLDHLSQLLGYSRVALPKYSFLISPWGPSDSLKSLLVTYHRHDVLAYEFKQGRLSRYIAVAKWDEFASSIDVGSVVTGDRNSLGRY